MSLNRLTGTAKLSGSASSAAVERCFRDRCRWSRAAILKPSTSFSPYVCIRCTKVFRLFAGLAKYHALAWLVDPAATHCAHLDLPVQNGVQLDQRRPGEAAADDLLLVQPQQERRHPHAQLHLCTATPSQDKHELGVRCRVLVI